jgi:hypothetical protein
VTVGEFRVGDRVRARAEENDRDLPCEQIGTVLEADGNVGITWRVLVDWADGRPPAFLDSSRVEPANQHEPAFVRGDARLGEGGHHFTPE